jgi:ATP-dependent DNA helicase RecG
LSYPLFHPAAGREAPSSLSEEEFDALVAGEGDFFELKTGTGNQPLQDAITAFSNADGGVIFIGVKDDRTVVGRELTQGTLDAIHQAARDVRDPGRFAVRQITVGQRPVVLLSIARRINGFAQTSNGRVLTRRGSFKVALFGDELRRLLVERSLARFEDHDTDIELSAVDPELLDELRGIYGWDESADLLKRLRERGLVSDDRATLTIAGAAYLLADPGDVLGKAFIEVLRFPANEGDYDRRVEIRGPLHRQVAEATTFVAEELGHELVVLGLQRHEIPRLPLVVLREAIANAVAHRSYESSGTAVRIEMRPDEVKILSPGGLPEPVTEENIRDAQAARNLSIIKVLRQAGLAEDAGRGIDVMLDSMRGELLDPPSFTDLGHAVEVSLPVRSTVTPAERAWVREVEARGLIQPADRLILVHAARGERVTNSRVRELLGIDSADARRTLRRLRKAQLLVQHGTKGGATYSLAASISAPAGLRLSDNELADVLLEMAREEPLTNAKVRSRTGLSRNRALSALDELVEKGKLVRRGERKGTRYVLAGSADDGPPVPTP